MTQNSSLKEKATLFIRDIMPHGAGALFFMQMFSTLSYAVLYSTLVLYMTLHLGFSKTAANSTMGMFIAFNYGLHLLGGYFGGRLLSYRALFTVGMVALVFGCVFLSFESINMLYWGLAAFLTGSSLNVTCINCMLTQRFAPDDKRRESAFLWNYSGMNVGFFVGFGISGYFQLDGNYQTLFLMSAIGNLIAICLAIVHWRALKDSNTVLSTLTGTPYRKRVGLGLLCIVLLCLVFRVLMEHAGFSNGFVLVLGVVMAIVLFVLALQQPESAARKKIYAYLILGFSSLLFWTLYQISPMGLTLFIQHNVDNYLWGYEIPPQWVQNVNSIIIVIGGPLLSIVFRNMRAKGYKISIPMQFASALLLIGAAFVILPIGILLANDQGFSNINWVIASYVLQSIGELFISPIGYAMVGQLAPASLQGVMMGSWMMLTGIGGALSQYFSNRMVADAVSSSPLATNAGYSHTFNMLGWSAIGCGIVLLFLFPILMRLVQGESKEKAPAKKFASLL